MRKHFLEQYNPFLVATNEVGPFLVLTSVCFEYPVTTRF